MLKFSINFAVLELATQTRCLLTYVYWWVYLLDQELISSLGYALQCIGLFG